MIGPIMLHALRSLLLAVLLCSGCTTLLLRAGVRAGTGGAEGRSNFKQLTSRRMQQHVVLD